jgi:rhomboid protease GluP
LIGFNLLIFLLGFFLPVETQKVRSVVGRDNLQNALLSIDIYAVSVLYPPAVMAGDWWRVITYHFLHLHWLHLLLNMVILYYFGSFVESILGKRRYLLLYLISGFGTGLIIIWFTILGFLPENDVYFGASDSIMGLIGATIFIFWQMRERIKIPDMKRRLLIVSVFTVAQIITDIVTLQAISVVHVSGMIIGFVIVLSMKNQLRQVFRIGSIG